MSALGFFGISGLSGSTVGPSSMSASSLISVTSTPYTVLAPDAVLLVNTSSTKTINLPNPSLRRILVVKDVTGTAGTNNITVARFGSEQIEGLAASRVLATNFGAWTFFSDGTNWWMR